MYVRSLISSFTVHKPTSYQIVIILIYYRFTCHILLIERAHKTYEPDGALDLFFKVILQLFAPILFFSPLLQADYSGSKMRPQNANKIAKLIIDVNKEADLLFFC